MSVKFIQGKLDIVSATQFFMQNGTMIDAEDDNRELTKHDLDEEVTKFVYVCPFTCKPDAVVHVSNVEFYSYNGGAHLINDSAIYMLDKDTGDIYAMDDEPYEIGEGDEEVDDVDEFHDGAELVEMKKILQMLDQDYRIVMHN